MNDRHSSPSTTIYVSIYIMHLRRLQTNHVCLLKTRMRKGDEAVATNLVRVISVLYFSKKSDISLRQINVV